MFIHSIAFRLSSVSSAFLPRPKNGSKPACNIYNIYNIYTSFHDIYAYVIMIMRRLYHRKSGRKEVSTLKWRGYRENFLPRGMEERGIPQ